MKELSVGDEQRITEIKTWIKSGMTIPEVKEELADLGYNNYHIAFILEKATGKKLVPKKPVINNMKEFVRLTKILVIVTIVLAVLAWMYFGGWKLW